MPDWPDGVRKHAAVGQSGIVFLMVNGQWLLMNVVLTLNDIHH